MKKERKIQYSKLLPLITGLIFIICLLKGFATDFATVVDVSFYVTAITVSGSTFGATIIFYTRKAQAENNVKLKTTMYKVAARERLNYNEQMMKLQRVYSISDEELMSIEGDSPMDDFEAEALSAIGATISTSELEADSPVELPNY